MQLCYTSDIKSITRSKIMSLTVSNKGWVVIPAELRKKYNLLPGTEVIIVDYGGVLSIVPALKNPVKQGRGLLKGLPSLTKDLLQERAKEKTREASRTR
jgi:AbrB family looped-hinge helix DNA binding protein